MGVVTRKKNTWSQTPSCPRGPPPHVTSKKAFPPANTSWRATNTWKIADHLNQRSRSGFLILPTSAGRLLSAETMVTFCHSPNWASEGAFKGIQLELPLQYSWRSLRVFGGLCPQRHLDILWCRSACTSMFWPLAWFCWLSLLFWCGGGGLT